MKKIIKKVKKENNNTKKLNEMTKEISYLTERLDYLDVDNNTNRQSIWDVRNNISNMWDRVNFLNEVSLVEFIWIALLTLYVILF